MKKGQLVSLATRALGEVTSVPLKGDPCVDNETRLRLKHTAGILSKYLGVLSDPPSMKEGKLVMFVSHDSSYSTSEGEPFFDAAERFCSQVYGIRAETGRAQGSKDPNILSDVIKKIDKCDLFVAIVTPDGKDGNASLGAPSPWITLELGIALGLNKPLGVLVTEDVSAEYHRRLIPHIQRIEVADLAGNFDDEFAKVVEFSLIQFSTQFVSG